MPKKVTNTYSVKDLKMFKDLILKNKQPDRSTDFDSEDKEKTSALGSLGLKPKPVH